MKRLVYLAVAAFLVSCSSKRPDSEGRIISAPNVDVIESELKNADADTLVVFDCDNVLTSNTDQILKKKNWDILQTLSEKNIKDINKIDVCASFLLTTKFSITNKKMPLIVRNLQRRNIRAVVLTGLSSAPCGKMGDPMEWRVATLRSLGYCFDGFWPTLSLKRFSNFFSTYDPCYYRGVVFCGGISKSVCLSRFLKYACIKPRKVIFIDDEINHLRDVGQLCSVLNIQFLGIEYNESDGLSSGLPFSRERADLQIKNLVSKGIWLSDEEATKRMKK
jgi:hypothetical protein